MSVGIAWRLLADELHRDDERADLYALLGLQRGDDPSARLVGEGDLDLLASEALQQAL